VTLARSEDTGPDNAHFFVGPEQRLLNARRCHDPYRMSLVVTLTEFGDVAVLLPLAAVMLAWLVFMRLPRGAAVWWVIAVAVCAGVTAILKIFFYGCPPAAELHSPSGHTSLSTLVYGAITLVSATEGAGPRRMMTIGVGAGLILAIAISRLLLNDHTGPEVGVGLIVGSGSLALFSQKYYRGRAARVWLQPLLVASGIVALVMHGQELHLERLLQAISGSLSIHCS
jgi:membrane-associated phospholipid phosphatase